MNSKGGVVLSEFILPSIVANVNGNDQAMNLVSFDFLTNRTVYLNGDIDDLMALSVITQLRYLDSRSGDDIFLMINSPGGSVTAGMAIYDVMTTGIHCDVSTVAIGMAASMGAFLLCAGTRGKRFAAPNAEIMIHQPLGGIQGQATDISLVAAHLQSIKKKLAAIFAQACEKPVKTLMNDMERDNWKTAQEAQRYGLVDHVGFPDPGQKTDFIFGGNNTSQAEASSEAV